MALTLDRLTKVYTGPDGSRVPIINIPEMRLADSEQAALVGTSGSGKTTLLHLIAGILAPDSGRIIFQFDGGPAPSLPAKRDSNVLEYATPDTLPPGAVDIARLSEAQRDVFRGRNIGYIFQTHHLLAGFTALENVLLGMSFTGRQHDPAWARHLLSEVGLADRLRYKPEKLSVGQQQRVAVARALANRPKLVLADEPTGALDVKNAQQVLKLIRDLCTEVKASLLLVSHDANVAGQFPRVLSLSELNRTEVNQ